MPHSHDDFTQCARGHWHWGVHGAAGLLLRHVDDEAQDRYFLALRSPDVQEGCVWSTPGGARALGECSVATAVREAREEHFPVHLAHNLRVAHTNDHGGWTYDTVIGEAEERFEAPTSWEHTSSGWFTPEEIAELPLHPGFRESWAAIHA